MQAEEKLFCKWDLVRSVTEAQLKENGTMKTLSVIGPYNVELMIFLKQNESTSEFEVKVYKDLPKDKYVPHIIDEVTRYEECDEYAKFFFATFDKAKLFVDMLQHMHLEYKIRPVRIVEKSE